MSELRPIHVIAHEIKSIWGEKINFGAKPYLDAMRFLKTTADAFHEDSAESIIRYGLSNMTGFRGEDARRLKLELKAHLK